MLKTNNELYKSCKYSYYGYTSKGTGDSKYLCQYIVVTGKSRQCEIGYCDKYVKGKRINTDPLN